MIMLCSLFDFGETSLTLSLKHSGMAMNMPFFGLPSNPSFDAGLNIKWCSGSTCFATYSLFFSKKFSWLQIIVKQPVKASNIFTKSCLQLLKPLELYDMTQISDVVIVNIDMRDYPFRDGPKFLLVFAFQRTARTRYVGAGHNLAGPYQMDVRSP